MSYIADDGTICETEGQMKEINKRIDRLLAPDRCRTTFGTLRILEEAEWIIVNISRRSIPMKSREYGFAEL